MIIIIFRNKLPGTKSPKGQLKMKNAEGELFFSSRFSSVNFSAILDHNFSAGFPRSGAQTLNLKNTKLWESRKKISSRGILTFY